MCITKEFAPDVYSVTAVLNTAYWCADRCVIEVKSISPMVLVEFRFKEKQETYDVFFDDFIIQLTHNELRERLKTQFRDVELTIVNKAFAPIVKSAG